MKIYTRTGDRGTTQLFGGQRVPKHHLRIEAYGTVDELNSFIGWLRDLLTGDQLKEELLNIQNNLFVIGSLLAAQPGKKGLALPELPPAAVKELEEAIDRMEVAVSPLRSFILPGGHPSVSAAHICRTVCRRAERSVTALSETEPGTVPNLIHEYLNRLSDYFFMLARFLTHQLGVQEIPWLPR
jgi:cob(I)alamin adenosyltransferase